MKTNISKKGFIEIPKICIIGRHIVKLKKENNNYFIDVDISYKDIMDNECFQTKSVEVLLDEDLKNITDIELIKCNLYIIEQKGIEVEYEISITTKDDKEVEIIDLSEHENNTLPAKDDKEIELDLSDYENDKIIHKDLPKDIDEELSNQDEIEEVKKEISKQYEEKLKENLKTREKEKDIVITTKKTDESSFLNWFNNMEATKYCIKTIECNCEADLNKISKEYNISFDKLIQGYDKKRGTVTFRYCKRTSDTNN